MIFFFVGRKIRRCKYLKVIKNIEMGTWIQGQQLKSSCFSPDAVLFGCVDKAVLYGMFYQVSRVLQIKFFQKVSPMVFNGPDTY